MSKLRLLILILLGIAFVKNSSILFYYFPKAETDWDQYVSFWEARSVIYEGMFMLFFFLVFSMSEKTMKAIACIFLILAISSFIDKAIFNIRQFLLTDYIVYVIAFVKAFFIYKKEIGKT